MSGLTQQITAFVITNNFGTDFTLILEPEGDCIEIPDGQTCRIVPGIMPSSIQECEIVLGQDKTFTLYLAMVKEVYVNSVKVR